MGRLLNILTIEKQVKQGKSSIYLTVHKKGRPIPLSCPPSNDSKIFSIKSLIWGPLKIFRNGTKPTVMEIKMIDIFIWKDPIWNTNHRPVVPIVNGNIGPLSYQIFIQFNYIEYDNLDL